MINMYKTGQKSNEKGAKTYTEKKESIILEEKDAFFFEITYEVKRGCKNCKRVLNFMNT